MPAQCQCTSIQMRVKMTVGFSLLLLSLFCEESLSTFEYTPENVKPLFDLMMKYGGEKKQATPGKNNVKQYLVVLMASNEEILNPPVIVGAQNLTVLLEGYFGKRLKFLLNENHTEAEFNLDRQLHGEVNFIHNKMIEPMNIEFRMKYPDQRPVVLMYSYYIPCADIQNLGYSCSEETAIFATCNWMNLDLLVAYSDFFYRSRNNKGTNVTNAKQFLQLAGIPAFQYQNNSLVPAYRADNNTRASPFLQVLFECLVMSINGGCMPDSDTDKKAIIALFVNQIAYECFKEWDFKWRKKYRKNVTDCFVERSEAKIGSNCEHCLGTCATSKKSDSKNCVGASFDQSLVPGEPADPSDPYNYTWMVTTDPAVRLNTIFREAPESRLTTVDRILCKNPSFTPQSLCTVSTLSQGSKSALSRKGIYPESSRRRGLRVSSAVRHPNKQSSSRSAICCG